MGTTIIYGHCRQPLLHLDWEKNGLLSGATSSQLSQLRLWKINKLTPCILHNPFAAGSRHTIRRLIRCVSSHCQKRLRQSHRNLQWCQHPQCCRSSIWKETGIELERKNRTACALWWAQNLPMHPTAETGRLGLSEVWLEGEADFSLPGG